MRAYETLTPRGQLRRLGAVARAAIEAWPISVARLRLLADATSATYRVDATDGTRYALRVSRPGELDLTQTAAEFDWLSHLAVHHPELETPRPIPSRDGRLLVPIQVAGVTGVCQCALLTWVPGVTPGQRSTPADHRRLGRLAARLHRAAETFTPPADFRPCRWDRICYFAQDEEVFFGPGREQWVSSEQVPMLRAAWRRCEETLARVSALPDQMVLHGDLHPWNVHRVRDRLRPLDFADLTWGHAIQDIAISLFYLTHLEHYPALRDAFAEGYATVRPYPAADSEVIETLHMARSLMFCNHIVRTLPAHRKTLPKRYDKLAAWMARGG